MAVESTKEDMSVLGQMGVRRFLQGTSFLALEHTLYMLLVAALPLIVIGALQNLCSMWVSKTQASDLFNSVISASVGFLPAITATWFAAALLVVACALLVLYMRTHAELKKRTNFVNRLAYKVPIYIAIGLLGVYGLVIKIMLLSTIFYSIVAIGTNVDIANLYLNQFLPNLLALGVVAVVGAYVWKLAQGVNLSRSFNSLTLLASVVLAVAILITSGVTMHDRKWESNTNMPIVPDYDTKDYFRY